MVYRSEIPMDIVTKINGFVPKEQYNEHFYQIVSALSGERDDGFLPLKKLKGFAKEWGLSNDKISEYGKLSSKASYAEALGDHYVWMWDTQNICFW